MITLGGLEVIIGQCRFRDWIFHCGILGHGYYLQVKFLAAPGEKGLKELQHGRKWYISPHATQSEIVLTLLKAIITAQEHEVREHFKFRGESIFDPHTNVEGLLEMRERAKQQQLTGVEPIEVREN